MALLHAIKCKAVYILESYMSQHANTNSNQKREQPSSQWIQVVEQLFDKLTGKGMSITYHFHDLEINIPRAQGPGGQDMGSAKWIINGKIIITTEAHHVNEGKGGSGS